MSVAVVLAVLAVVALSIGVLAALGRMPTGVSTPRPVAAGLLLGASSVVFGVESRVPVLPGLDVPVLEAVVPARSSALTALADALSLGGGTVGTATAGLLAALACWWWGRPRWALVWVATVIVGALVIRVVKPVVERPRPPVTTRLAVETTASLPSGHALMAALGLGLVAVTALALPRAPAARRWGRALAGLGVLLALAIGASRVYLGVHWASDVLAGWMLGAALALTARSVAGALDPADPVASTPQARERDASNTERHQGRTVRRAG